MGLPIALAWAAAGALARVAAQHAARLALKKIAQYAAKQGVKKLVKSMVDKAWEQGKRKLLRKVSDMKKKGELCPTCTPSKEVCKTIFGGQKSITPGVYRGGAKGSLGSKKYKIEGHHIPANQINGMLSNDGPAIQMDYKDHLATESWGRRKSSGAFRHEQGLLVKNGKFMGALAMDIMSLKAIFGSKYDGAIKEAVAYMACLDAVTALGGKKK